MKNFDFSKNDGNHLLKRKNTFLKKFIFQGNFFWAYFSLMIFLWKISIFLKTTEITSLSVNDFSYYKMWFSNRKVNRCFE
jgi:hypothetical protein